MLLKSLELTTKKIGIKPTLIISKKSAFDDS